MSQSPARTRRRAHLAVAREGHKLDAYNESLAAAGRYLHPTKGFRSLNPKRDAAATIAAMTLKGYGISTAETREALLNA